MAGVAVEVENLTEAMVQIFRIYFHSQEAQDQVTFNSSEIFKTHLSPITLLEFLLILCFPSTRPKYISQK